MKRFKFKMNEKVFPTVLICLNLCAMVPYVTHGNLKMSVYWFAAALLNFALTWL